MNKHIYLLLGANQGEKLQNLRKAKQEISLQAGAIVKVSSLYQTAAWGKNDQDDFYNEVVEIQTPLNPQQLLSTILQIEKSLGRLRIEKWGARIIDIDILFYGEEIVNEANLKIPHPAIADRRFALTPLSEITPDFVHPILNKTISTLLAECTDTLPVVRLDTTGH